MTIVRILSLATLALCADGCEACFERTPRFTLNDAQIDRVTEGTGTPTLRGCAAVCHEVQHGLDVGTSNGGLRSYSDGVMGCTLSEHIITCNYCEV